MCDTLPPNTGLSPAGGPPRALPIQAVLPDLCRALDAAPAAVVAAAPGAGKTTGVPLALLGRPWMDGRRLVVLEPRRLAARAAARRMAALLDEEVGGTVGYRTRLESRIGPGTRIEVVTEGVLARRVQADPELAGVGAVLFDEFHERSAQADLALALCLDVQRALRPDLRLVVMSATLDTAAVAGLLGGAPVIECPVPSFPVETRYLDGPRPALRDLEPAVAAAVRRAHGETAGGILVFLPGEREIRRVEALLAEAGLGPDTDVEPLYGALPPARQDAAIAPAPAGRRKVVLATAIAETSLTIADITVVVDGGFMRGPRFDPRTGLTRLETLRVTRDSADQRRGRAGRVAAGTCVRLWSEAEHRTLQPHRGAEILEADLAPLALDLALWGVRDAADLSWLDPPPAAALTQARDLLADLGALDGAGAVTGHGRAMAGLALHPRLAHMVLRGRDLGLGGLACDLAALLGEGEILARPPGARTAELASRLEALHAKGAAGVRAGVRARARTLAQRWRRHLGLGVAPGDPRDAGRLVALAYPDRVARRRPGGPARYVMANGRGAALDDADPLAGEPFLAVAQVDGAAGDGRVFLAAPLARDDLEDLFADRIVDAERVVWDPRAEAVQANRRRLLGRLVLAETPLDPPPADAVTAAVCDGIRRLGLEALPWTRDLIAWRHRVAFAADHDPDGGWPDLSDGALLDGLEDWLGPFLAGVGRRAQFARIDLAAALRGRLAWDRRRRLDDLAPAEVTVPSGARRTVDYGETPPVLAVKLQEMFGQEDTPRVAGGRVALALHLLSPAGRPLQVTRDLAGFWRTGYASVRAEMRGRYPKHPWPEDPMSATPTARTKGR
ncbi:MAG: ATP-dependent helicase HrpB [Hyphomicrobiales bacterium]|nr:ATP-dependent helicase HrpB [Hyphomicrobiales bacterium]